jgi:O-antigen/teichoic acid export membrane protein
VPGKDVFIYLHTLLVLRIIINTFTSNVIIAVLNLIIAIVISQYLGASGKGEQSIFITNIALLLVVCNIVGGASLVYLVPRFDNIKIIGSSYIWTLVICSLLYFFLGSLTDIPSKYVLHICVLSSISSFSSINSTILLGYEKIRKKNLIAVMQTFLIIVTLLFLFAGMGKKSFSSYLTSLYVGYIVSFLLSTAFVIPLIKPGKGTLWFMIKEMFRYGFLNQLGHIFQLLSFRISYYLLLSFLGEEEVGVYSTGVSLVESVWVVSRSIATVQYARIANSTDNEYSQRLTVQLLKLSFLISIILLFILSVLPSSFYIRLFGEEFVRVNEVIILLSPGIIFQEGQGTK